MFRIQAGGDLLGFLLSTRAKGRFEYFDYTVLYSSEMTVLEIIITAYRSDHGAGICQKRWLRQFEGYQGSELQPGRDFDAVSGGTISSISLADDLQRCHRLMNQPPITP
jgi:hypothetical protein